MTIAETILGWLSLPPERAQSYSTTTNMEKPAANPLHLLEHEYPDLAQLLKDKAVLDFGCGFGNQVAALANSNKYSCRRVHGLDAHPDYVEAARRAHPGVTFIQQVDEVGYDVVISQDAMEHYPDPAGALRAMKDAVQPGGLLLITFGPPWYAPYGSHMHFFCKVPWLNLLFSEKTIMKVRKRYRQDGAERFDQVESGLNKMSLAKFEDLIRASGLEIVRRRYGAFKRLDFLSRIPLLRELCVIRATVVLRRPRWDWDWWSAKFEKTSQAREAALG